MTRSEFWQTVFSEKGSPSSKRVLGAFMIIICLGLIIFLAIMSALNAETPEGICPDNIKHLIELILILASSLLGISSITGIWKDKEKEKQNENT